MSQIIITGNNVVQNGKNNQFVYDFPNSVNLTDCEICVHSVTIIYSWFNISSTVYNNQTFSHQWYDNTTSSYETFYDTLVNCGKAYGILINEPLYIEVNGNHESNWIGLLKDNWFNEC